MRERLVIELPDLHSFHSLIGGSNPAHNHEIRPADADLISWLGLRNDYRTLLDIQEPVNSALGFEKTGKLHKRVDQ
jgi:hypothetical protein